MEFYREAEGNLFAMGLPAIGHGVNTKGIMGAGIAEQFRVRYPGMYGQYRRQCQAGLLHTSGIMPWVSEDGTVIFNLATQVNPGADASVAHIHRAVGKALVECSAAGIPSLGIPRIGCGIGGLEWENVRKTLKTVAKQVADTELVVVSLPEKARG